MDHSIRLAAFEWLEEQSDLHDDVLPYHLLTKGFEYQGRQVTLAGPKGIWKPKMMQYPISIITTSDGPYDDAFNKEGFLNYRYRGTDPYHPDNAGLREMMKKNIPLIYFHTIFKGKYIAVWPVYIIGDLPDQFSFTVAVEDKQLIKGDRAAKIMANDEQGTYFRRAYLTTTIKTRLHQKSFRERVLHAYRNQCSLCRLRHQELLDAAHIIGDKEDLGDPVVNNGLSLCKIHHAAFDKNILGISPDYEIKVRTDILHEIDGPMLKYGLQSLNDQRLILPVRKADWPDQERLEVRFGKFLKAG